VYQKALEIEFQKRRIKYRRELFGRIEYDGQIVGRYFLDFFVEDKVALELKVRRQVYESDWIQLLNYLKSENLKVGLLIVFTKYGLKIKRVINDSV
jgi:GxxExxY protein